MTDEEILNKYENDWSGIGDWATYLIDIPTNDLIRITKCDFDDNGRYIIMNIDELKTREIPEELKLEVLLILGDEI